MDICHFAAQLPFILSLVSLGIYPSPTFGLCTSCLRVGHRTQTWLFSLPGHGGQSTDGHTTQFGSVRIRTSPELLREKQSLFPAGFEPREVIGQESLSCHEEPRKKAGRE